MGDSSTYNTLLDDLDESSSSCEESDCHPRMNGVLLNHDETPSETVNDDSNSNSGSTENNNLCGLLCASCSRLDLSISRFIIDTASSRTSNEVRNYYLRKSRPVALPDSYSASTTVRLTTLSQLRWSALKCSFCELVKKALPEDALDASHQTKGSESDALSDPELTATWEIDGRARAGYNGMKSRTRRLHLKWSDEALGEAYVVFVPSDRYTRPPSDAPSVFPDDALFLGRPIDSTGKNRALMKSWLDLCRDKHGDICRRKVWPSKQFLHMLESSWFGVIDVYTLQLTDLPYSDLACAPYAALSYVWGGGGKYKTLLENVMGHRTHGGLEAIMHKLPQAIQDAIALVPTLGLRYLWVDSLCIVQDSARSWKLNAYGMNLIYGHATVTICAADGKDATEGLRAMHRDKHNSAQFTAEIQPGFRLMLTKPPETAIRRTTWDSRAWTFQERLLSSRTLIFVDGRVYFQCRSTGMSEDIVADQEGAGWSLDLVNAPLQILRQVDEKPLWVYTKTVELYTRRSLTEEADILAAFSGMYRMLESKMRGGFVFGLPTSHFDLALLWQSKTVATRRLIPKEDAVKLSEFERDFPSWAWCGWKGSSMLYDAATLDGVFRDTNAWLMNHTWITWYVRDGYGDLRPLWDKEKCTTSVFTDHRWRGYDATWDPDPSGKRVDFVRAGEKDPPRGYDTSWYADQNRADDPSDHGGSESYSGTQSSGSNNEQPRYNVTLREPAKGPPYYNINGNDMACESNMNDLFGRKCKRGIDLTAASLANKARTLSFRRTLREFPYRVVRKAYESRMGSIEYPIKPVLQFHTLYMRLNLVPPSESGPAGPHPTPLSSEPQIQRYSLADDSGDWCGSIALDSSWFRRQQRRSRLRHEFIAISDAMRFSDDECATWTYYIPKEREESEWDLFYILLIQFEVDSWKRVGLGKVFKEAFSRAEWKEIILG